jgi:hypothetical protein
MRSDSSGPPGCTDGDHWEAITDDTVAVDSLTFQYQDRDASDATKPLAMNLKYPVANRSSTTVSDCTCVGCTCTSCPCGCPANGTDNTEECLQLRTLIITIDAHLARDDDTTMSLRERVKVRNDRFCTDTGGSGPSC